VAGDGGIRVLGPAHELVQCRERAGHLERPENRAPDPREVRVGPPRVARIEQPGLVVDLAAEGIALPSRRARRVRLHSEDPEEFRPGGAKLGPDGGKVHPLHVVLPAVVVVAVDPRLKPRVAHRPHRPGVAPADVRGRQQGSVEEGPDAIDLDDAGPADLAEKPRPEDAGHRPARLVGSEGEEEAGRRSEFAAVALEVRHPEARSAICVDVNLERESDRHGAQSSL
jgi:hypothetical protein